MGVGMLERFKEFQWVEVVFIFIAHHLELRFQLQLEFRLRDVSARIVESIRADDA